MVSLTMAHADATISNDISESVTKTKKSLRLSKKKELILNKKTDKLQKEEKEEQKKNENEKKEKEEGFFFSFLHHSFCFSRACTYWIEFIYITSSYQYYQ